MRSAKFADAKQADRALHFVFQQFEQPQHAGLAGRAEREALHAADGDQIGAGRDRLDDIRAAADRAVDDDLGAAADRIGDLWQHVDRAAAVIELAAAVVRHVDPLDAVLDRDRGVLGGGDALDQSGILNFFLMRSTVFQSSPAWNARFCTRRRPAVTKRLAMSRSRRL